MRSQENVGVPQQQNAATGVLNAFGAKASQAVAGATQRWARTGARTSSGKAKSGNHTGGSMTNAGSEDVDMRESYSTFLERSASDQMDAAMPDIDVYDHDNPLCVTQYVNDIYQYWYSVEVRATTMTSARTSMENMTSTTTRLRMRALEILRRDSATAYTQHTTNRRDVFMTVARTRSRSRKFQTST